MENQKIKAVKEISQELLVAKIVEVAKSFVGQKEIPGNKGWEDKAFEAKMRKMGWWVTAPWCMFLCRLVWKEAYAYFYNDAAVMSIIGSNINGSSIDSAAKVRKYKDFEFSDKPVVGAIVIWSKTKTSGHGAIVISVNGNNFTTVEGNTNEAGSREGDRTLIKKRSLDTKSSMTILGFVIPKVF